MNFKRQKGLILTEVMLAIALLSVAVVATASIIQTAVASRNFSRGHLIAQNLVVEGLEVVKSLRAGVKLKCPENINNWLLVSVDNCAGNNVTAGTSYFIEKDDKGRFKLNSGEGLTGTDEDKDKSYRLYFDTVDEENDKFTVYSSNSRDTTPSNFYREIVFKEVSTGKATVEVKVLWKEGAKVRDISGSAFLYNY